jgi:hypothetical protein
MERQLYYVVLHRKEWRIKYNDELYGPYETQKKALNAAIEAANRAGGSGAEAQVIVQGENNYFRTEWTYGEDPYPPPG